jgi:integrase
MTATMTLKTLLHDYYAPVKGISDRTIRLYEFTIKAFGAYLAEAEGIAGGYSEPTTADLNQLVVARFLAWRLRSREPATAAKDRAQLRACWEFAAREKLGGVERFPTMRTITVPERIPEAWLIDEMRRLIESSAAEQGSICGIPAGSYFRSLLMCCYETGERISAVMSLTWADVRGPAVVFRAEGRKGRRRDIIRSISPDAAAAIDAIAEPRRALVWPFDKVISVLYHRMDRILRRAGLPHDRRCKFHRVRKTAASYYRAAGGNSQKLLDHSSPAVTERYLDPRIVTPEVADAPGRLPKVS